MLVTFSTDTEFYDLNILTGVALKENPLEENPDYVQGDFFIQTNSQKYFFLRKETGIFVFPDVAPSPFDKHGLRLA